MSEAAKAIRAAYLAGYGHGFRNGLHDAALDEEEVWGDEADAAGSFDIWMEEEGGEQIQATIAALTARAEKAEAERDAERAWPRPRAEWDGTNIEHDGCRLGWVGREVNSAGNYTGRWLSAWAGSSVTVSSTEAKARAALVAAAEAAGFDVSECGTDVCPWCNGSGGSGMPDGPPGPDAMEAACQGCGGSGEVTRG